MSILETEEDKFDTQTGKKIEQTAEELSGETNNITGETVADQQNEETAKKRNWFKILAIAAGLLLVALTFGYCMTRSSKKRTEVNLPPQTVQLSNSTGQLVENLTATPTPMVNPNGDSNANVAVQTRPNPVANTNANYTQNPSGLYQADKPVTQQTQNFDPKKNEAETARNNNSRAQSGGGSSSQSGRSGGGSGGGSGSGSGNSGYERNGNNGSSQSNNNGGPPDILGVENRTNGSESTAFKTKAVFYGSGNKTTAPAQQKAQMSQILANKNLNFNNIPFGTLLPVRTIGAVHTLLPSSLCRLELTQTVKGDGWTLPAGTVIVGQVSAGVGDRVNIMPKGFILNDQFYSLEGELSGTDGGIGMLGDRKTIGRSWYKPLLEIADKAQQSFNSWLAGRGGGNLTNIQYPSVAEVSGVNPNSQVVNYVAVKPNASGYLLVTRVPNNSGVIGQNQNNSLGNIPSSIQGFSVEDVGNILGSGNQKDIENLLRRKP